MGECVGREIQEQEELPRQNSYKNRVEKQSGKDIYNRKMEVSYQMKQFYWHNCAKQSLINVVGVKYPKCPKCSSEFVEELVSGMNFEPEFTEEKKIDIRPEEIPQTMNTGPTESSYSMTYAPGEARDNVQIEINTGPCHGSYSYIAPQPNSGPSHGQYSYVSPPRPQPNIQPPYIPPQPSHPRPQPNIQPPYIPQQPRQPRPRYVRRPPAMMLAPQIQPEPMRSPFLGGMFYRHQRPRDHFFDSFRNFGMPFGRRQATMLENLLGTFPSMPTMFDDMTQEYEDVRGHQDFGGMRFEDLLGHFQQNDPNRQGPPPAQPQTVNRLLEHPWIQRGTEKESWTVCQEDYKAGDQVITLRCEHCFHPDCLRPWLQIHNTCPVCRESVD